MTGRIAAIVLVLGALLGGFGMYYLQVYGYYHRLQPQGSLSVAAPQGETLLSVTDFEGIDSDSSPLRYRACFRVIDAPDDLIPYPAPSPINAPRWFTCFDAATIGSDLTDGRAAAYLVEANFLFGFDRVMALYPDGRAVLWHQINTCGEAHFDGRDLPQGCPPAPER